MLKVVVQTIKRLTMKAAAAAKTGRQRAASHNSGGNNRATGTTVAKNSDGRNIETPPIRTNAEIAKTPSMSSLRDGTSRVAEASPITSGATAMIPSPSDATQCCQVLNIDVVEL